MRMLVWLIIIAGALFLGFAAFLYFAQGRMVFVPTRDLAITPTDANKQFSDVYVEVADGERVNGWYFEPPTFDSANGPVVLFCHGNAGNISHRLETAMFLLELDTPLLLFDYRGYGRSDGKPSEQGVYADAEACYNWLIEEKGYRPDQIVLFGRSLGGAVAVELATRVSCRGLIIESSFTSAPDMGRKMFPFFPVRSLLKFHFDSIDKIARVQCPVLVTHSPDDDLVPYEMGKQLYDAAEPPKRFVDLAGGHNGREYFGFTTYREAVAALLDGSAKSW